MVFECTSKTNRRKERWTGKITELKNHGSHYEMRIDSRSGILVIFGRTMQGGFACMPDFGAGCHLVNLKDKFWNTEKLIDVLGKVDGITVAEALFAVSDTIEKLNDVKSEG
jgi:hypothetical protein